jgi:hypothetical protein
VRRRLNPTPSRADNSPRPSRAGAVAFSFGIPPLRLQNLRSETSQTPQWGTVFPTRFIKIVFKKLDNSTIFSLWELRWRIRFFLDLEQNIIVGSLSYPIKTLEVSLMKEETKKLALVQYGFIVSSLAVFTAIAIHIFS